MTFKDRSKRLGAAAAFCVVALFWVECEQVLALSEKSTGVALEDFLFLEDCVGKRYIYSV